MKTLDLNNEDTDSDALREKVAENWKNMKQQKRLARNKDKENRRRVKLLASAPGTKKNADLTQTMSNVGSNQVLHESKALAYKQCEYPVNECKGEFDGLGGSSVTPSNAFCLLRQ